jgi:hypothetical protein
MGARLPQPGSAAAGDAAANAAGPGPGEYHSEGGVAAARGPAFSMAGRPQDNAAAAAADIPGPGETQWSFTVQQVDIKNIKSMVSIVQVLDSSCRAGKADWLR